MFLQKKVYFIYFRVLEKYQNSLLFFFD